MQTSHEGLIREAKAHLVSLTVSEITHLMFEVLNAKENNITGIIIKRRLPPRDCQHAQKPLNGAMEYDQLIKSKPVISTTVTTWQK